MGKRIMVAAAHDDDAILGVGGRIAQHVKKEDDVYVAILADGRNSHKIVLGIKNNPTPSEVMQKRRQEIILAMCILGIPQERLYFLNQTDGEGETWQNSETAKSLLTEIMRVNNPDIIYFHHSDAHPDHRAVNKLMKEVLRGWPKITAYQFFIWTKELAEGRPEVDASKVPAIPDDALRINIQKQLATKLNALFRMHSQVNAWPYPEWQPQAQPILPAYFINHFLKGEEIFVAYKG